MKKFILLVLLLPVITRAQGLSHTNVALYNSGGNARIVPSAVVTVCAAADPQIPCTTKSSIYTNYQLTSALVNPFNADANGNYSFYAGAGNYTVTVTGIGITGLSYQITLGVGTPSSLAGPGTITGTFGGDHTTTGTNTHSGAETFTGSLNCKNLEGTRCVDPSNSQGWAGATADAWLNAAAAALPTIAGGLHKGTVYIADGAYSLVATVNPNGPVTFLCNQGKATLTWTVNNIDGITLSGGGAIYGCNLIGTFDTGAGHIARAINSGYTAWSVGATENSAATYSPTFANANGHQYNPSPNNCVTAGAEPTWPTTPGATVVDNTCTWTEDGVTTITIQGNYIAGWGSKVLGTTGAAINTGGNSYGWQVISNRIEANGNEGMLIGNLSQNINVLGNIFQYNFYNGLDVNGRNNVIQNNQFLSNGIGRACGTTDQGGMVIVGIAGATANNNTVSGNVARLNQGFGFYLAENGGNADGNIFEDNVADGNSNGCTGYGGFEMTEVTAGTLRNNRMTGNISINHTAASAYGIVCLLNGGVGTYLNNQCAPNTLGNNTTNYSTSGQGSASFYGLRTQSDGLAIEHSSGGGFTNLVPSGASFFQINPPGGSSYQFYGGSPGEVILPAGGEILFTEGTPPGGAGAGTDTCYGDSTAHLIKCSNNNGTFSNLSLTSNTSTTTAQVQHASTTAGIGTWSAIATGDLPTAIPIGNIGSAGLSATAPIQIAATGVIDCAGAAKCVTSAAALTNNSPVLGGALQASKTATFLTTDGAAVLTVGVAGGGNGAVAVAGNTSGVATLTAPAVAGTATNPATFSNSLQLPSGTVYNINNDVGWSRDAAGIVDIGNGTAGNASAFERTGNTVVLTSNFTTASASLVTITGLSWTFPATNHNYRFFCHLSYSQATAAAANSWGIQATTTAPTNLYAAHETNLALTTATAAVNGTLPTLTTTTATNIGGATWTPSAFGPIGTVADIFTAKIWGMLEQGAGATTLNIMVLTGNASDSITVYRGSSCSLGP